MGRQFGLPSDQRRALLKGLVRSLLAYDRIVTTETRAKDVKAIAEKLITTAKKGDIHAKKMVRRYVDANVSAFARDDKGKITANENYVPARVFDVIAPRYVNRNGGYCRITKLGARRGDAAPLVLLELLPGDSVAAAPVVEQVAEVAAPKKRTKKSAE